MEERTVLWFRPFYGLFSSIGQTFSPIRRIVVGWAQFAGFSTAKDIFLRATERDPARLSAISCGKTVDSSADVEWGCGL
jgi:hypothetical protein